jgi:hypothetical protein
LHKSIAENHFEVNTTLQSDNSYVKDKTYTITEDQFSRCIKFGE